MGVCVRHLSVQYQNVFYNSNFKWWTQQTSRLVSERKLIGKMENRFSTTKKCCQSWLTMFIWKCSILSIVQIIGKNPWLRHKNKATTAPKLLVFVCAWYRTGISNVLAAMQYSYLFKLYVYLCVSNTVKMLYGLSWNTDLYRKLLVCSRHDILCACVCIYACSHLHVSMWCVLWLHMVTCVFVTWCTASNILSHQPSLTLMYSQMSLCIVDWMIYCSKI